jgi:hypothetical protein
LRNDLPAGKLRSVNDELISRDEVVALLFNVSNIAGSLERIEGLLGGEDEEEEEADGG